MTKEQFREELLNSGLTHIWVVSFPDYKGGRDVSVCADEPELGDFEYIEWEGDLTAVLRDRRRVFTSLSIVFHEEPKEFDITLEDLVLDYL